MASEKKLEIKEGVSITDEVVAIVAGLACTEVDGVHSLTGNLKNSMIAKAGAGRLSKALKLSENEDGSLNVRLSMNIIYGVEIPTVGAAVQEKVKSSIENMTGIQVREVNIRVASVIVEEE